MISERAPAKVNLALQVGTVREDGLHELCSIFASVDLADELTLAPADRDEVVCPGVDDPNLVTAALGALRDAGVAVPPLRVEIVKRIPVAAGLGGGSADAAAALRAANRMAGEPLGAGELRTLAAGIGADVPSQVEPRSALVTGAGEGIEPLELPQAAIVLWPDRHGLSTRDVYGEADRLGSTRARLDPAALRQAADGGIEELARAVGNDLQPAALSLRPELAGRIEALVRAGALVAAVTGSGPTVFGLFGERADADRAAAEVPGALVTMVTA